MIELASGHVFAKDSVRAVGPLLERHDGYAYHEFFFVLSGVGFVVEISQKRFAGHFSDATYKTRVDEHRADHEKLRQEAISKLL